MRPSSAPEASGRETLYRGIALFAVCASLVGGRAVALELHSADATYADGVFRVAFEGVLDAPVQSIEAVLFDYTRYRELDPRIKSAQSLGPQADGSQLVRTLIDACAGPFCRTVKRVERLQHEPGLLLATVVPESSDMRHGVASTRFQAMGERTLVIYHAEFEPDFWVPGPVGHYFAVRALRTSIVQMFANVEDAARAR